MTRLHYDAGDAHGWLAQLWGAKLFVLYPPEATPLLRVIPEEARRRQQWRRRRALHRAARGMRIRAR